MAVPAELRDSTGALKFPWHAVFEEYDPELFAAFNAWSTRVEVHKDLDAKTRDLITVALAAIVALPSPFIDVHIHRAFDSGVTIQELLEAIVVAGQTGGGCGHAMNHGFTSLGKVIGERQKAGEPTKRRRSH